MASVSGPTGSLFPPRDEHGVKEDRLCREDRELRLCGRTVIGHEGAERGPHQVPRGALGRQGPNDRRDTRAVEAFRDQNRHLSRRDGSRQGLGHAQGFGDDRPVRELPVRNFFASPSGDARFQEVRLPRNFTRAVPVRRERASLCEMKDHPPRTARSALAKLNAKRVDDGLASGPRLMKNCGLNVDEKLAPAEAPFGTQRFGNRDVANRTLRTCEAVVTERIGPELTPLDDRLAHEANRGGCSQPERLAD